MDYILVKKDLENYSDKDLEKMASYLNVDNNIWDIAIKITNTILSGNLDRNICSNKIDLISTEEWNDENNPELAFDIYKDDKLLSTTCYKQKDLIKTLEGNPFCVWVPRLNKIMDDTGHGGEPDCSTIYFKLSTDKFNLFIEDSPIVTRLINGTLGRYRLDFVTKKRIGSIDPFATLEISALHGQAPGEDIYKLNEIEVIDQPLEEFEEKIQIVQEIFPDFYNKAKRGYFQVATEIDSDNNITDVYYGPDYLVRSSGNEFSIIQRKNNKNSGIDLLLQKLNNIWYKKHQGYYKNDLKDGVFNTWSIPDNKLIKSIEYKNDKKDGKSIDLEDEKYISEEIYKNGNKIYEKMYSKKTGNPILEINYNEEGKEDGKEISYYEDGKIQLEALWVNGNKKWQKEYYENGNLMRHAIFDDRGLILTQDRYDENGKKITVAKRLIF